MSLGLCVSPGNFPDNTELAMIRPAFLRSILFSMADLEPLLATGLPLLLTINNEMQETGWWSTWEQAIRAIADRAGNRVLAVSCGNELDLFNSRNPSDVPPEFAADLVRRTAPILRAAGIKVASTSLAGPDWQDYLARMVALCGDDLDYVDLHAYGQRPDGWGSPPWMWGDLRPTLIKARQIAGRPVIMSEYGVKINDAGGEGQVAAFLAAAAATVEALGPDGCPHAAWFAWRDQVGAADERGASAFGLVAEDGRRRPAWSAYAALAPSEAVIVPPVVVPAPIQEVPVPDPSISARDAAWCDLWQSATASPSPVPFNTDAAFYRYWQTNRETAGLPVGPEHSDEEGVFQAFSRAGVLRWTPDAGVAAA